jgi:hypothetical protein
MRLSGDTLKHISDLRLPCLSLFAVSPCVHAQVDVLTQHNDNLRTGVNLRETMLTRQM